MKLKEFRLTSGRLVVTDHDVNTSPQYALKLLFVCSRNRMRSLTAERVFKDIPGIQARSAGTQPDARVVVTEGHLGWADMIFFMERSHLNRVQRRFREALAGKPTIVLRLADEYEFMQPELIAALRERVTPHLSQYLGTEEA